MSLDSSTEIISNPSNKDWNELVPSTINSSDFYISEESPVSAQHILESQGYFTDNSLRKLEEIVWDAFINEDYEEDLHMLTIREKKTGFACGLVVWRDVEAKEMKEWIDDTKIKHQEMISNHLDRQNRRKELKSSGDSILLPLESLSVSKKREAEKEQIAEVGFPTNIPNKELYEAWVKIELVATHSNYFGKRIGTMLLASALVYAAKHNKKHSIVHVAGGEQNTPASKLYKRFGFLKPHKQVFNKPNNHLHILWNIQKSLQTLNWNDVLPVKESQSPLLSIEHKEEKHEEKRLTN